MKKGWRPSIIIRKKKFQNRNACPKAGRSGEGEVYHRWEKGTTETEFLLPRGRELGERYPFREKETNDGFYEKRQKT